MATAKPAAPSSIGVETLDLPESFTPAFRHVQMQPGVRIDDGLACIAMLTNQSLEDITNLAYELGLKRHGPAWVYSDLIRRLLANFELVASEDLEAMTIDALPDVAMFLAEYDPATSIGRWVLWHHIRGTDEQTAMNIVYDPAGWVEPRFHISRNFKHLLPGRGEPIHYLQITPKPVLTKGKAK
jgi:hypothetical protein